MVQSRRFHANVLFFIPLTQGVLLLIFLDFCKNVAFFVKQLRNLSLTATITLPDGTIKGQSHKDPAYLVAQYAYALWLICMALKAIVGFRANLKFSMRWMSVYCVLLGLDTAFEFVHTILGIIFGDNSSLDDNEIIRHYAINFLILLIQCYGFFCVWMHNKWVSSEMPHLLLRQDPPMTLLRLMFPMAYSRASDQTNANTTTTTGNETTQEVTQMDSGAGTEVITVIVNPRTSGEGANTIAPSSVLVAPIASTTTTPTTPTPEER